MAPDTNLKKIKCLIVDDNPIDRTMIRSYLTKMGLSAVDEAENGKIATLKMDIAVKMEEPYRLIITDWQMPERDGMDLLKTIRGNGKKFRAAVVLMTSHSGKDVVDQAILAKVDDFVVKPVEYETLHAKIMKLLIKRPAA